MNELNYPVRDVFRKMVKYRGTTYDIGAFIVSKCYVVREIIDYSYLEPRQFYNVVYTHEFDENNNVLSNVPKYDEFFECSNSIKVDKIYDSYYEAKREAEALNDYLIESVPIFSNCHSESEIDVLKNEKKTQIKDYYKLEDQIMSESSNIKITRKKLGRVKKERL